jgi:cytochrome c-type biogenesis protein CcmH/NrfG
MADEPTAASASIPSLRATQVYTMAIICLVAGLAIGYLLRGSQSPVSPVQHAANAGQPPALVGAMGSEQMPSRLEEMKQMAHKQVAPLLEKLKSDPNDSAVLAQIGAIYHTSHQFKEAAVYYGEAVQIDPKNVALRTKLASSLYRAGDVEGAITQLNRALSYQPNDANALFDLGMIRLQGKRDGKGALAAWQQLLKTNPQLSADRKATVEKLMADVMTTLTDQQGIEGARSNGGHK